MKVRVAAEERDFTKEYADACWRRAPRISPDSWRVNGGLTTGELWLDGRAMVAGEWGALHEGGVNGVLCSPATLTGWQALLQKGERRTCVLAPVTESVMEIPAGVELVLWQMADRAELADGLRALEQAVAAGKIGGYGLRVERADALPWDEVWQLAKKAAAAAWGRRKRPGWQALLLPLGIGNDAALTLPVWEIGGERVSLLEGAARQGLLVLAEAAAPVARPADEVIAAVERVAGLEVALVGQLGGWPQRGGVELFSVLRHLQQGVPLWPGEGAWRTFIQITLPALQQAWGQVAGERSEVRDYLVTLEELAGQAQANGLVAWGAEQMGERLAEAWRAKAGAPWAMLESGDFAVALVASVPGISGVLGRWTPAQVVTLMTTPNLPDTGMFFAK